MILLKKISRRSSKIERRSSLPIKYIPSIFRKTSAIINPALNPGGIEITGWTEITEICVPTQALKETIGKKDPDLKLITESAFEEEDSW